VRHSPVSREMSRTYLFLHTSHSDVKFYLLLIQETTACTDIYTF